MEAAEASSSTASSLTFFSESSEEHWTLLLSAVSNIVFLFQSHGSKSESEILVVLDHEGLLEAGDVDNEGGELVSGEQVVKDVVFLV